jgi:hypothetical protein
MEFDVVISNMNMTPSPDPPELQTQLEVAQAQIPAVAAAPVSTSASAPHQSAANSVTEASVQSDLMQPPTPAEIGIGIGIGIGMDQSRASQGVRTPAGHLNDDNPNTANPVATFNSYQQIQMQGQGQGQGQGQHSRDASRLTFHSAQNSRQTVIHHPSASLNIPFDISAAAAAAAGGHNSAQSSVQMQMQKSMPNKL